jgi:hypothetical protein
MKHAPCHFMDLADRLQQEGPFEVYRDERPIRSKQVWLTEPERDMIVKALSAVIQNNGKAAAE